MRARIGVVVPAIEVFGTETVILLARVVVAARIGRMLRAPVVARAQARIDAFVPAIEVFGTETAILLARVVVAARIGRILRVPVVAPAQARIGAFVPAIEVFGTETATRRALAVGAVRTGRILRGPVAVPGPVLTGAWGGARIGPGAEPPYHGDATRIKALFEPERAESVARQSLRPGARILEFTGPRKTTADFSRRPAT